MTTNKTLIEQATLTDGEKANIAIGIEVELRGESENLVEGHMVDAIAAAARDKALWTMVEWLDKRYGYMSVNNPARDLKVTLNDYGIERPKT